MSMFGMQSGNGQRSGTFLWLLLVSFYPAGVYGELFTPPQWHFVLTTRLSTFSLPDKLAQLTDIPGKLYGDEPFNLPGSQTDHPIELYPVFAQKEEASAIPTLTEREDIQYIGQTCSKCCKPFTADDVVIHPDCAHLVHRRCLSVSCTRCSCDCRSLITAISQDPAMQARQPELSPLFFGQLKEFVDEMCPEALDSSDEDKTVEELIEIASNLSAGQFPPCFPEELRLSPDKFRLSSVSILLFRIRLDMWALIDQKVIANLAGVIGSRRCLEVFAGRGWLARGLREAGVSVIATDLNPEFPVTDVISIDAVEAVGLWTDIDILIISWPPMGSEVAFRCVQALADNVTIIYIGEWEGCCAERRFFEAVEVVTQIDMPSIPTILDFLLILRKKKRDEDAGE